MRATLVVPDRDPAAPSGGDVYDARVAEHWPDDLRVCRAPGTWPRPSEVDRSALGQLLGGLGDDPVLIDGLVGSAVPELVAASARVRATGILVHSTLSAGSGATGSVAAQLDAVERRALRAADLVATTSAWSAADLRGRYGVEAAVVARPGVDPATEATGSWGTGVPRVLVLSALTPVKNHVALLTALGPLRDLRWRLTVAGPAPDPGYRDDLLETARLLGLAGRIEWPGHLEGEALERVWARTDLLVHPSRSETWGMVVTEAHARGIPAVVTRGTGAEEALTWPRGAVPGAAVDVDDPAELTDVLRRWLTDGATRSAWRAAALERRDRLTGWQQTAQLLHDALASRAAEGR